MEKGSPEKTLTARNHKSKPTSATQEINELTRGLDDKGKSFDNNRFQFAQGLQIQSMTPKEREVLSKHSQRVDKKSKFSSDIQALSSDGHALSTGKGPTIIEERGPSNTS